MSGDVMMVKDEKKQYLVSSVVTASEPVIVDRDGKALGVHEALARILNDLDDLKAGLLR